MRNNIGFANVKATIMDRKFKSLKPADRVIVPKRGMGIIKHHGIYAGRDFMGRQWFLENNWENGVQYVLAKDFFNGVPSDEIKINLFNGSDIQRKNALIQANRKLGKEYNLFLYNCEHFSNEVQLGKSKSMQVIIGILLTVLFLLILRHKGKPMLRLT